MLTAEDKQLMINGERPDWLVRKAKKCIPKAADDPTKRKRRSNKSGTDVVDGMYLTTWRPARSNLLTMDTDNTELDGTPDTEQAPKKKRAKKAKKTRPSDVADASDLNLTDSLAGGHSSTPTPGLNVQSTIDPNLESGTLPCQDHRLRYGSPPTYEQDLPNRLGFTGSFAVPGSGRPPYYS